MRMDRRAFLSSAPLFFGWAAGCGRRRGTGYPGYAFVANAESHSVTAVDLTSFRVTRQIRVDGSPGRVVSDPARPAIYVLAPDRGTLHEIDSSRLAAARKTRLAGLAVDMRMSGDGRSLWVLCREPHSLARVALDRLQVATRIKLPSPPNDFDIGAARIPAAERLGVVSFGEEHPGVIVNLDRGFVEREVDAGENPRIVRLRADGSQVLAANEGARTVTVADVASGKMVVRLPVGVEPKQFCFKADGGQLFVTGPGLDAVVIVHPYQTEVSETLLVGHAPGAMAASWNQPEYLFVANPESGGVTVLDIETRRVLASIAVGEEPGCILFTPDNQYALVLNHRSGDVAVIRVASILGSRPKTVPHTRTAPLFTMIPVGMGPVSAAVRAS